MTNFQSIAQSAHSCVSHILRIYSKGEFQTPLQVQESKEALFRFQKVPRLELFKEAPKSISQQEWDFQLKATNNQNLEYVFNHIRFLIESLNPEVEGNFEARHAVSSIPTFKAEIVNKKFNRLKKLLKHSSQ